MKASIINKLSLVVTVVAMVLYIVGFASPNWLQKDFTLKLPVSEVDPRLPPNLGLIKLDVKSEMGLLKSCNDKTVQIPVPYGGPKSSTDCGSDGAADWQTTSAGLGIAALVMSIISLGLSIGRVFVTKLKGSTMTPAFTIIVNFFTAGLIMSCLLLYALNKKIQVDPRMPDKITYDVSWAYIVTVVSDVMFGLLVILNALDMALSPSSVDITKESAVSYHK